MRDMTGQIRARVWLYILEHGWTRPGDLVRAMPDMDATRCHDEVRNMLVQKQLVRRGREYAVTMDAHPPRFVTMKDIFNAAQAVPLTIAEEADGQPNETDSPPLRGADQGVG